LSQKVVQADLRRYEDLDVPTQRCAEERVEVVVERDSRSRETGPEKILRIAAGGDADDQSGRVVLDRKGFPFLDRFDPQGIVDVRYDHNRKDLQGRFGRKFLK